MAYPQGIDVRATSGFVTDPTNCTFEIGTTANYPRTSAQGNTVGWEDAPSGTRDRSAYAGASASVAGVAFNNSAGDQRYRFDLPSAGNYKVRLAAGDVSANNDAHVEIFDTTTSLGVLANLNNMTGDNFVDATSVTRTSNTDWATNNALSGNLTFATTILRFKNLKTTGVGSSVIAHMWVESGAAAVSTQSAVSPMPFYNTISIQE